MSLYAEYIKERQGFDCLEDEDSFVTYKIKEDYIFIEDLYVRPEMRRKGKGTEIGNKLQNLALELNLKALMAVVDTTTNNWKVSLESIKSFGFNIVMETDTTIFLNKELNNG